MQALNTNLIGFWGAMDFGNAPFVHPKDLLSIPARLLHNEITSYSEYVEAFKSGKVEDDVFHPHLLPQPYHGDIHNADIILLLLNPGFHAADYLVEEQFPAFRDELLATISQERKRHLMLDPEWAWTPGFTWWYSKLQSIARRTAQELFNGHLGRALDYMSSRICTVELVPYHSRTFSGYSPCASSEKAKEFVKEIDDDRTVIVTRGAKHWDLPDAKHVITYPPTHARSASLSSSSIGGRAILRAFGIETH